MVKKIIEDDLMDIFNWSGKSGKKDLSTYKVFSKVLFGKIFFFLNYVSKNHNANNFKKNAEFKYV